MMFCEATRHHTPIRHPANFWSNLLFLWAALGILCLTADERAKRSTRPYQLLDIFFGCLLLVHSAVRRHCSRIALCAHMVVVLLPHIEWRVVVAAGPP